MPFRDIIPLLHTKKGNPDMNAPSLYDFLDENRLHEMLDAFHACLDTSIQIIDAEGKILKSFGETTAFCQIFKKHLPSDDSCERLHIKASRRAIDLGETYIFSCHANLNHIVFPLMKKGTLFGAILAGPFLMDKPDSLLISDIAKRYDIPTESLLEMYEEANNIQVIPPSKVTKISKLLYYLFTSLISDSRQQFEDNQGKFYQQSKINESIQMYKSYGLETADDYPYDKEKELLTKVKTGNMQEARGVLNDLLGYVFFSKNHSLEVVKTRSIELCSLLSRAAIEGGAPTDSILKINNQYLRTLQEINNMETLCYKLQEVMEVFTENMFNYIPSKSNEVIRRAISYISQHYNTNLTLEEVANHVYLNPAYFSTLFRQSCGSTFKEYLNIVRVEESKRLLANTDYSIIDIAVAVGFDNQSYFSKVFKKYTGLTPKQYR